MPDNVELNAGTGGSTIASDDIAGIQHQRVKVQHGIDGSATDVSTASPLPVGGAAAENAAVSGNPNLVGGRYDATPRTLGDGDVGAIALDVNGHAIISPHAASVALVDNVSNTVNIQVDEAEAFMVAAQFGYYFDGTAWDRMRGDSTNGLLVNVAKNVPGTGATNLGKAIDSVVGATDTGVALLAKHQEDQAHLTTADGDYDILTTDSLGSLHVNPEAHHIFDELDVTTGWTALGNDTLNLATTTKHCIGVAALTFDKVNGAANTVFAGIQKTLSSTDLGAVSAHDILQSVFYIPDLTDVSYIFLRLGTDSSNYNEWRIDVTALTAATFEIGALSVGDADYTGITGNGWDASAITYIAVGVAFNTETDALAGIIFDQISYHTNQHGSVSIASEVTSSVSSANVNINKIGGKVVNTQSGNVATGTQRVTIATDDVNLALISAGYNVAHDAADSGNPVKTGAKAVLFNGTAPPNAAAAEGDRVNSIADEYGRQYVETTHPNFWDASVDYAAAQTNATVKAAPGAGLSLYITDVIVSNGATAGNITLLDGSAGTVILELYPAITGGLTHSFKSPIKLTANTLLAITSTTVTTHSVTVSGFIAP